MNTATVGILRQFIDSSDHQSCPAAHRRPPSANFPSSRRLSEHFPLHLARRTFYDTLVLSANTSSWRSHRWTVARRTAVDALAAMTACITHVARTTAWRPWADLATGPGRARPKALDWILGPALFLNFPFSKNIYLFKYSKNSFKLPKFVAIHRKFIKRKNKFYLNTLE
jgi:hypothetical protein